MQTSTITTMNKAMNWIKKPVLVLVVAALIVLAFSLVFLPQKADAAITYVVNPDGTVTRYDTSATTSTTTATTTPKNIYYTPYTYFKPAASHLSTSTATQAIEPYVYYRTLVSNETPYTGYVQYPLTYWNSYPGANALGTNTANTMYGTTNQYQYPMYGNNTYNTYNPYANSYNYPYGQNNWSNPTGFSQTNGFGNGGFKMTSGGY